jgi:energy-coupling factor transport system substrate-specific component
LFFDLLLENEDAMGAYMHARYKAGPMGFITAKPERITVHELARVWTERKGLVLIAATAILYLLVLIPFNQLQWVVAGIAIRPAAALPVVFGILFGPAAAWGLGIGNVAGDLFGSWSLMSIPGFAINVLYPYLSYLLWHRMMRDHEIRTCLYSLGSFLLVTFVSTLACMALLALSGTVFFARPFASKFISYFGNNIIFAMTLGAVIYWLVLERAVRGGFVYGMRWDERKNG